MDILVRDAVVLDLVSTDKRGVLDELSYALAEAEPAIDRGIRENSTRTRDVAEYRDWRWGSDPSWKTSRPSRTFGLVCEKS